MDSIFLLPLGPLAIIFGILLVSFVIFGIAGFGTVLLSGPLLALYLPISITIPLIAILDFIAALLGSLGKSKKIDKGELKRLIPFMILGSLVGATLLFKVQNHIILIAFGAFAIAYGLYSLSGFKPITSLNRYFSIPFGLLGGVFSALFGSGGFIYSIYLSNRIQDKDRIRITQKVLLIFSTVTRIILFFIAGVYLSLPFLFTVLALIPAMLIGIYIGKHINLRISKNQFLKFLSILILLSGTTLIVTYFTKST